MMNIFLTMIVFIYFLRSSLQQFCLQSQESTEVGPLLSGITTHHPAKVDNWLLRGVFLERCVSFWSANSAYTVHRRVRRSVNAVNPVVSSVYCCSAYFPPLKIFVVSHGEVICQFYVQEGFSSCFEVKHQKGKR